MQIKKLQCDSTGQVVYISYVSSITQSLLEEITLSGISNTSNMQGEVQGVRQEESEREVFKSKSIWGTVNGSVL